MATLVPAKWKINTSEKNVQNFFYKHMSNSAVVIAIIS